MSQNASQVQRDKTSQPALHLILEVIASVIDFL